MNSRFSPLARIAKSTAESVAVLELKLRVGAASADVMVKESVADKEPSVN